MNHNHHHHHHVEGHNVSPAHVTIGIRREGLDYFDDLQTLEKHPAPYRIHKIKVQFNKEHILGVRFTYLASNGHSIEGHDITKFKPFGELFGHVHEETFEIHHDDDLLEIHGRAGVRINEIGFKTYKGHSKTYGHPHGEVFAYQFPGASFGAVSGGYGQNLDFLEVRVHSLLAERVAAFAHGK